MLRGSSSVPTLPAAVGGHERPASRGGTSRSSALLAPGETIEKLVHENELLQAEVRRERQRFQRLYVKDFKSPARRRLDPMRKLVAEQSDTCAVLSSQAAIRQQRHDAVVDRVHQDAAVQQRRLEDVTGRTRTR